jgi:hypothetical protein
LHDIAPELPSYSLDKGLTRCQQLGRDLIKIEDSGPPRAKELRRRALAGPEASCDHQYKHAPCVPQTGAEAHRIHSTVTETTKVSNC